MARKRISCALTGIVCSTIIILLLYKNPLITVSSLYFYASGVFLGTLFLIWYVIRTDWEHTQYFLAKYRVFAFAAVAVIALSLLNASLFLYQKIYPQKKPNVILVSIDTLRADHLGCYGYQKNTSPNLDIFAQQNILFENFHVNASWTLPSHMSMLTALYPVTHGIFRFNRMRPEISTLAEYLKNDGYTTVFDLDMFQHTG